MRIAVTAPDVYRPGIDDVIRVFYPGCSIQGDICGAAADIRLALVLKIQYPLLQAESRLYSDTGELFQAEQARLRPCADEKNETRRLARLVVYRLLEKYTGVRPSPWGIMTGIRPTKVVHRLLDEGLDAGETREKLLDEFALAPEKAGLVTGIALHQRPYLPAGPGAGREVGVYIGIPFCPSRCLYCSFPAYPKEKYRRWVAPFVNALLHEIDAAGRALQDNSLAVCCIYVGGGTPTCLEPEQLAMVLETLNRHLRAATTVEFTVEGGRPETLTGEILAVCRKAGVTRLSINPQTMQEHTLRVIGRSHKVGDVADAVERARAAGFLNINMDVIAGLPGETVADMRDTLEQVAALQPENLSVHTLAVKKASQLRWEVDRYPMPTGSETAAMVDEARRAAGLMGMLPYYMYRQKNTLGHQENIGYTLPGRECLYNIMVMEERHTVIGLGAGAGSKYLLPDGLLLNRYNPRDPWDYVKRLEEIITKKETGLAALRLT